MSRWLLPLLTLIAGLLLTMLPLPTAVEPFRPDWVAMIALYWALALPRGFGLLAAWLAGLMLDVSQGALLGQHALGLALITAVALNFHQRVRVSPVIQQALFIMLLLVVKEALVLWTSGLAGRAPDAFWLYFASVLTGAVLWPVVFFILRDLRRRYGVA